MEAVLKRNENDVVEAYWSMLSALSRTVKLKLVSRLTDSVLEEEEAAAEQKPYRLRTAKVKSRAKNVLSDDELEARFSKLEMPEEPEDDFSSQDIVKANSGRIIKPIEKWL